MFRANYFMMVWQVGDGPCRKIYTWNDQYVPLSVEPGEKKSAIKVLREGCI
jgi:hypothetical protein